MKYQMYSLRRAYRIGTSNIKNLLVNNQFDRQSAVWGYYSPIQSNYLQVLLGWGDNDNIPDIVHLDDCNEPYIINDGKRIYPPLFTNAKKLEV